MQLVNQRGAQILPNSRYAPTHPNAPARLSIIVPVHPPPYACVEEPLHQLRTPDAERILEILVRPGTVAVDGNCEALDAEFRHYITRCMVGGTVQRWAT